MQSSFYPSNSGVIWYSVCLSENYSKFVLKKKKKKPTFSQHSSTNVYLISQLVILVSFLAEVRAILSIFED